MFEPDSKFTDSLSYDLTAWALPYIYNLKSFAVEDRIKPTDEKYKPYSVNNKSSEEGVYAFLAKGTGFNELKLMAALYTKKINVRYAQKPFSANGVSYPRGALIVAKGDNKQIGAEFEKIVIAEANRNSVSLESVKTGLSEKGIDLGSNYTKVNKRPEVALIGGEGTSAGSFGELWYFFERELNYQITIIEVNSLTGTDLNKYDVILLPSGSYTRAKDKLLEYAKDGGRIVAFDRAISLFAAEKTTKLFEVVEMRKKELESAEEKKKSTDESLLKRYENSRRESLNERSANSIYRVKLDDSHPYTYGLGSEWFIIKRAENYPFLKTGNNIGYITENEPVSGFAGSKFTKEVKNTLVIGSERVGRGEIVYITDDPYFRGFWKSGRVLLGNLVMR
jgi:hypothetical protein